jgi:hypothetical protein
MYVNAPSVPNCAASTGLAANATTDGPIVL